MEITSRFINCEKHEHEFMRYVSNDVEKFNYEKYFVISPAIYTHNYNIVGEDIDTYISKDILEQTRRGAIKIIFNFSTEDTGFLTKYINRHGSTNTYEQFNAWAEKNNIVEHCLFITMFEKTSIDYIQKQSVEILFLNTTVLRFDGYTYDTATHLSETVGDHKSILWLNRRLRAHRRDSIDLAIEHNCNFDDMYFSLIGSKYETQTLSLDPADDIADITHNTKHSEYILNNLFNKEINLIDTSENWQWLGSGKPERIYSMFNIRAKSSIEVVSEFTCYDHGHIISEKIIQPIISKKPFVVIGDRDILKSMRAAGFKTFSNFWDERYDDLYYHDRLVSIAKLISNLQKTFDNYTLDKYNNVIYDDKMSEILDYNYNHYYNVYKPALIDQCKRIF